jgi:hypothetical protein
VEQELRADRCIQLGSILPPEILVHWEERLHIGAGLQIIGPDALGVSGASSII